MLDFLIFYINKPTTLTRVWLNKSRSSGRNLCRTISRFLSPGDQILEVRVEFGFLCPIQFLFCELNTTTTWRLLTKLYSLRYQEFRLLACLALEKVVTDIFANFFHESATSFIDKLAIFVRQEETSPRALIYSSSAAC